MLPATLTGAVIIGLRMWPDVYRSETLILVDSQKIPEQFVSATVSAELQDRLATLSQQILSSSRLQKIIDTYHLYEKHKSRLTREEILEKMRDDINIKLEKGWAKDRPGAFRISYEAPTAQLAMDITTELGSAFVEENLRSREVQAEGTSEFFKTQLAEAKKTLDELEARVSAYKLQHNGQLPQQEPTLIATLTRLQIELEGNQDAVNRAEQQKSILESAVAVAEASETSLRRLVESSRAAGTGSRSTRAASDIQRDREALESRLEQLRLKYRDEHPDIRSLSAQLEYFKRKEVEEAAQRAAAQVAAQAKPPEDIPEGNISPEVQQALMRERERVASLRSQLQVANKEVALRKDERQQILTKIGSYQSKLESLPIREQEMAAVTRDYEISKAHYMSLLNKIYAVDMAADMERRQKAERFTVLDPARLPEKPVAPNRQLLGSAGALLAIIISVLIAVGLELKKNVLLGEWELPATIPVLGRVPIVVVGNCATAQSNKRTRRRTAAAVSACLLVVVGLAVGIHMWARG